MNLARGGADVSFCAVQQADALLERNEADARSAAETMRINALDKCRMIVMIADTDNKIT